MQLSVFFIYPQDKTLKQVLEEIMADTFTWTFKFPSEFCVTINFIRIMIFHCSNLQLLETWQWIFFAYFLKKFKSYKVLSSNGGFMIATLFLQILSRSGRNIFNIIEWPISGDSRGWIIIITQRPVIRIAVLVFSYSLRHMVFTVATTRLARWFIHTS